MMSELISKNKAITALVFSEETKDIKCGDMKKVLNVLKKIPSAETERKKGKWIDTGSGQECSVCGEIQYGYDNYRRFCANCGADMRGCKEE